MSTVTIRSRKYMRNALLRRRQMVLDVIKPMSGNVSHADLTENIAKMFKVKDTQTIVLFGFNNHFGGGKETGFCLIYDDIDAMKRYEPKHRLARKKIIEVQKKSRKTIKESKNHQKKVWGTGVRALRHKTKNSEED